MIVGTFTYRQSQRRLCWRPFEPKLQRRPRDLEAGDPDWNRVRAKRNGKSKVLESNGAEPSLNGPLIAPTGRDPRGRLSIEHIGQGRPPRLNAPPAISDGKFAVK